MTPAEFDAEMARSSRTINRKMSAVESCYDALPLRGSGVSMRADRYRDIIAELDIAAGELSAAVAGQLAVLNTFLAG